MASTLLIVLSEILILNGAIRGDFFLANRRAIYENSELNI